MPTTTKTQATSPEFSPLSIARMLWKQRRLAVVIWLVISAATVVVVQRLRAVYKAEVLVLVDPQRIPESFVSATVGSDIADRLALISQDIMSRTRLFKIIEQYNLYPRQRQRLSEDEVVQQMRKDINVTVEHSWTGGRMAAFRLSYQGTDPKTITEVANRLAALYVAENYRSRENQAEGTVQFLDSQLDDAKWSLDEQEAKVSQFKLQHNGELPQQENSILTALGDMRVQLQGAQDAINRGQNDKMMLETTLRSAEAEEEALVRSLQPKPHGSTLLFDNSARPKTKVEALEEKLQALLTRYTPNHPDVQEVEQELAIAKQEQRAELANTPKPAASAATSDANQQTAPGDQTPVTPELLRDRERIAGLRAQLVATKRNLEAAAKARENLITQISSAESRASRLPIVEQEMAALTRDYQISQANYKSLLDKKLAAGVATDMERSKKSERFNIIDPARVPQKPFKPKRAIMTAAGSIGGLGLGLLVGFGIEYRKRKLLGEWELPLGTVILGRVPVIRMSHDGKTLNVS
jgi:polysaccharide chain length determinant protein (PEP-CTERM system associated)